MGGLADEYYNLVWRSVREGAHVVEEVFGVDPGFERAYRAASETDPSLPHRFFVTSCYVARRILAEILESITDLPKACDVLSPYMEEVLDLVKMLRRDIRDEIVEYNIRKGRHALVLSLLRALETLARGVIGYCETSTVGEV